MIKMKPLLKESTWADRKFGEPLPTLEDYVTEADDDKYVSVGWGKYKEKVKRMMKMHLLFLKRILDNL